LFKEQARAICTGLFHMIRERFTWFGLGAFILTVCAPGPIQQVFVGDISIAQGLADTLDNLSKAFQTPIFRLVLLGFGLWFFGVAALRVNKKIELTEIERQKVQSENEQKLAVAWRNATDLPIKIAQAAAFRQEISNFRDLIDRLKESTDKENNSILELITKTACSDTIILMSLCFLRKTPTHTLLAASKISI
jgi:hypothetical protein